MIDKLFRNLAPIVDLAIKAANEAAAGGSGGETGMVGLGGSRLADLDMSGEPPAKLIVATCDDVVVKSGDVFAITVDGDGARDGFDDSELEDEGERVRFSRKGRTLAVMRLAGGARNSRNARVTITLPPLRSVTIAGSGTARLETMARDAEITIAGSGSLDIAALDADKVDITLAGSGHLAAQGRAERIGLTVAGSGSLEGKKFHAGAAKVTVAGSGHASFASDGHVKATIVGSGNVSVLGHATCQVTTLGSGSLVCEPGSEAEPRSWSADADSDDKALRKAAKKKARKAAKKAAVAKEARKAKPKKPSPKKGKSA